MAEFASGDVVRLKSGGPSMTVTSCEEEFGSMRVYCVWFDDKHNEKSGAYPPATLDKVEPTTTGGGSSVGKKGGWMGG